MRYLAAVDTVHTAAALCDYLGDRAGAEDEVVFLAVHEAVEGDGGREGDGASDASGESDDADRDRREALNVAEVRLAVPAVETVERRGAPAEEILAAAADRDVDEVLLGVRGGTPEAGDGVGSTATAVLTDAERPVVVVPDTGP